MQCSVVRIKVFLLIYNLHVICQLSFGLKIIVVKQLYDNEYHATSNFYEYTLQYPFKQNSIHEIKQL